MLDSLYTAMVEFPHIDSAEFKRRWDCWDIVRGQHVSFLEGGATLTGESKGIDDNGHLKVQLDSGELRAFGTTISQVRW